MIEKGLERFAEQQPALLAGSCIVLVSSVMLDEALPVRCRGEREHDEE
jgi:hypothetical protein